MKEYKYTINGNQYAVSVNETGESNATVVVNGEEYNVIIERPVVKKEHAKVQAPKPTQQAATAPKNANGTTEGEAVKAPLPGVINDICVAVGDRVEAGQTVIVLEAMKMANNIDTEVSGIVTAILVEPGQTVMEGTPLVTIA